MSLLVNFVCEFGQIMSRFDFQFLIFLCDQGGRTSHTSQMMTMTMILMKRERTAHTSQMMTMTMILMKRGRTAHTSQMMTMTMILMKRGFVCLLKFNVSFRHYYGHIGDRQKPGAGRQSPALFDRLQGVF